MKLILTLLLGLTVLAIAVPNSITRCGMRRDFSCASYLKQIDSAKEQWAIDNRATVGAAIPAGALWHPKRGYIKAEPKCPMGATYLVRRIGESPACSHYPTPADADLHEVTTSDAWKRAHGVTPPQWWEVLLSCR
jgi:hypothetical protein